MVHKYTRPPLYQYQSDILNSPARYTVTEAATKVGKTASHVVWLFEQALKGREGQNFWWAAPVYGQAEIAFNRLRRQVTHRSLIRANESKLTLTLPTGAIMQFKSADKPDNLYGDDVQACVFDEFTRAKEAAWHALRSTLTATKGKCKFIGNVKGKGNWGYKLAMRAKDKDNPDWEYFKITAYDAVACGLLDLEEVEAAKRELPEHVFNELYMAEAAESGTNPFGEKHIAACIKPLSTKPPVVYGIDLAKSVDYTVIIGLDEDGNVCYIDRFQKDWHGTKAAIRALDNLPMAADSTGVGDPIVEELQMDGLFIEGVKFTSGSKQQLMLGLSSAIQQQKIGYPKGEIVDELEIFEYQFTLTGVRYTAPEGFHDDCVMALALAWRCWLNNPTSGVYSYI